MIPDANRPYTPGWYFKTLFNELTDLKRRQRLQLLRDYREGKAPLPQGAENAREAYEAFCRMARTNFADLIVSALAERMELTGFRSAADADATGDPELAGLWRRAGLDITSGDVHKRMLSESEGYVIVGAYDPDIDAAVVTEEDPLYTIGMPDPDNPRRLIAGLKIKHDIAEDVDRVYLYLAGKIFAPGAQAQLWVATRRTYGQLGPMTGFHDQDWSWEPARSGVLPHGRVPMVRFLNADGLGEYEQHLDLLDRINHQILQRMTVAVMQAFRQRAIEGLPTVYPKGHPQEGQTIDYGNVFVADPAAVWHLPPGVKMWESGQVDLRPILEAVAADVQHLASVTRTPLHLMAPAGDNQSAEGANLQREGLTFRAKNRIKRTSPAWVDVVALMQLQSGPADVRALSRIEPIWASPELLSLSERGDASSKAQDIPWESRMSLIWGFDPATIDRMKTERLDDMLLQQQLAQVLASAAPAAAPGQQAGLPTAANQRGGQAPPPGQAGGPVPVGAGREVNSAG
ncbi:hypothetical protein AB0F93_00195 [Micromonospora tulbaghiae]|uniref:hypothetical protein n=1 Tax=Micromonospora tulbaghiae TaxID=479978 RepID=UPI003324A6B1